MPSASVGVSLQLGVTLWAAFFGAGNRAHKGDQDPDPWPRPPAALPVGPTRANPSVQHGFRQGLKAVQTCAPRPKKRRPPTTTRRPKTTRRIQALGSRWNLGIPRRHSISVSFNAVYLAKHLRARNRARDRARAGSQTSRNAGPAPNDPATQAPYPPRPPQKKHTHTHPEPPKPRNPGAGPRTHREPGPEPTSTDPEAEAPARGTQRPRSPGVRNTGIQEPRHSARTRVTQAPREKRGA